MNASEKGSTDWWKVIRTMPWQEALMHLNDYRAELLVVASGTSAHAKATAQVVKINSEVKRINVLIDESRYTKAMRMVLNQEQMDLVIEAKRDLERKHWSAA